MRAAFNKFVFASLVLTVGILCGLVVSGRMSLTAPSIAGPEPPQSRPAAIAAATGGALPNLSDVAERALKVAANITSTVNERVNDPFYRMFYGSDRVFQSQSAGSGVIVSADGYILTNKHVIGSESAEIKVTLPDSVERPAKIIGIDEVSDLAVIKVDAKNLSTLPWGDSSQLRVAEWVLAVGNPFQLSGTVTLGIVSTVSRSGTQVGGFADYIQTDAAINPGNSGGALINARGELVGINTMIYTETGGYQGIGFAIPSNLAQSIWKELRENGEVVRGTIGLADLRYIDAATAEENRLGRVSGVLIVNLYRGSSAVRAGLRRIDIIAKVDGQPVTDSNQLLKIVYNAKIGSTLKLEVWRGGRATTVDVAVEKLTAR
jgi:S1-C subfamily serine protease